MNWPVHVAPSRNLKTNLRWRRRPVPRSTGRNRSAQKEVPGCQIIKQPGLLRTHSLSSNWPQSIDLLQLEAFPSDQGWHSTIAAHRHHQRTPHLFSWNLRPAANTSGARHWKRSDRQHEVNRQDHAGSTDCWSSPPEKREKEPRQCRYLRRPCQPRLPSSGIQFALAHRHHWASNSRRKNLLLRCAGSLFKQNSGLVCCAPTWVWRSLNSVVFESHGMFSANGWSAPRSFRTTRSVVCLVCFISILPTSFLGLLKLIGGRRISWGQDKYNRRTY